MTAWGLQWLSGVRERLRQRRDLLLEFIVLRHQLAVLQRTGTRRPCFRASERLFWVFLSRWWANWQRSLFIVQPATVLRWRRRGLWAIWVSGSYGCWHGGRPRISSEVRALIVRMSKENFLWGAPPIHGELLKLGFDVSQATVSRYMPRRCYPPSQSWRSFLRNQALGIGTISLGEAGRISDQLLTLARRWIERVVRCAPKVRDGIFCSLIKPPWTWHQLWASRSSNHADWRVIHGGCMPVRARRTARGGDHWTMAGRRPSPYRSRASPRRKLPAFTKFAGSSGCQLSRTSSDSDAKPDNDLENHSMLAGPLRSRCLDQVMRMHTSSPHAKLTGDVVTASEVRGASTCPSEATPEGSASKNGRPFGQPFRMR